ncbi:MAG: insulinase family protein [Clostridiales bacterium]|nr:insulinase family protein [Clostridiales bacterium]
MNIKEIRSESLDEKYYEIDHDAGLKIYVMPKENYSTSYAIFGTKYGSIDTSFRRKGQEEFTTVPEGIAHFLEHKLFESEELDAFERYAETGASANAYTSFDRTCYLFSCSGNFAASLEILLDFVQNPYFTKETVEKEQGIIGQEIRMYEDVASWMVLFNLLRALYHEHPVRIDIAGTVESIADITDELLYACYHTFYHLNNMVLCVAGDVDVDEVVRICGKYLKPSEPMEIERNSIQEPRDICKDKTEYSLAVSVPVFALGFKEACEKPEPSLRDIIETNIMLECVAGRTSQLYHRLLDAGLINTAFSSEYFTGNGYESILFDGESREPERVAEEIKKEIRRLKQVKIQGNIFESARRKLYGHEIMSYNNIEELANEIVSAHFSGYGLFDVLDMYRSVTLEDVNRRLARMLDERYSALSVVRNQTGGK